MSNIAGISGAIEEHDRRLRRRLEAEGVEIDPLHPPREPLPEDGERCAG